MIKYDSIIVNHQSQIAKEDVANHVKLEYLGQLRDNSSVERALYCPKVPFQEYVYVPGICSSEIHQTGEAGCLCGTPGHMDCTPADEGFYIIQYVMLPTDCGGGGASPGGGVGPGSSPISTGPYNPHGGGGGINDDSILLTPCKKLKDLFNPSKINVKPLITGGMYDYINDSSKGEGGIYLKKDQSGNITSEIAPYTDKNQVPIKSGGLYYSAIHMHPKNTFPMFSWTDIYNLFLLEVNAALPFNRNHSSFLLVCEDENGVKQTYAIIFEDIGSYVEETLNSPENIGCSPKEICKRMDGILAELYRAEAKKTNPNYERVFLQFNFGTNIGLYKANTDLTNWSKLSISENTDSAIVNSVNCN